MKRKQDDDGLNELSRIYRDNPLPSKDIDMERYKKKIEELEQKYGKYDEIGNPNKHRNKPIDATILEWKEAIQRQEDKYRGKPTKSWDGETLGLD